MCNIHIVSLDSSGTVLKCLRLVLRPVVKFCLRWSLSIQDLNEACKAVFVQVVSEELEERGEKINISRIALTSGLHRRDVMRLLNPDDQSVQQGGLVMRVIGQWQMDKRFQDNRGKPRELTYEGERSDFHKLVSRISKDLNPGTFLFELERIGAISRKGDKISLIVKSYNPRGNPEAGFALLAADAEDLMCAVEENIYGNSENPNLHAKTAYDNIRLSDLPKVEKWILKEASTFHEKVRKFIAQYDCDLNPKLRGSRGARVVLGTFSRVSKKELD